MCVYLLCSHFHSCYWNVYTHIKKTLANLILDVLIVHMHHIVFLCVCERPAEAIFVPRVISCLCRGPHSFIFTVSFPSFFFQLRFSRASRTGEALRSKKHSCPTLHTAHTHAHTQWGPYNSAPQIYSIPKPLPPVLPDNLLLSFIRLKLFI